MNTRILWTTANLFMVVALLLLSCGPKAAPTPTPAPALSPAPGAPAPAPAPAVPAPATPTPAPAEKPKYGGTINVLMRTITEVFDSAAVPQGMGYPAWLVYDQLVFPDWSRGTAGTRQVDWGVGQIVGKFEDYGPELAESWKIPEVGTWVMQIRRGVHFALDPSSEASRLVNGRELTADDVVWNVMRYNTDPAYPNGNGRRNRPAMSKAVSVEKTGPWEVTIKTPVDPWAGFFWVIFGGNNQHFFAPEVIKKYGNGLDWHNAVGTRGFIISDFVSGSVSTLRRNPNYWKKDPAGLGQGSQLPYVDTVKILTVPDSSTRLAAMRTGRADWLSEIEWEDGESLRQSNPKLNYYRYLPAGIGINFRIEKADLPFKDKRVRQALMMATDFEAFKNDFYRGQAEIQVWPIAPTVDWLFIPLKDLPGSLQALYKYNPDKAKQLLAEAGYPNGFKTKMVVENISSRMDPAAIFKAMWAKVGIDVELQPRETAVFSSITSARSWDEMLMGGGGAVALLSIFDLSGYQGAVTGWTDQAAIDAFAEIQKNVFINMPKSDETYKKLLPHLMEQAYVVPRPTPWSYTFWQPWVKNHHGETDLRLYLPYVWIDQDLREKMTGRR